jgi:hypothetical protein
LALACLLIGHAAAQPYDPLGPPSGSGALAPEPLSPADRPRPDSLPIAPPTGSPTLGNPRFDAYTDRHGITTGRAGNQGFEAYTDRHGITSVPSGQPRVTCVTDRLGITTCR